jgi:hypothetical protein
LGGDFVGGARKFGGNFLSPNWFDSEWVNNKREILEQYVKGWFKEPPRVVEGREGEIAREQKKRTVARSQTARTFSE